jgi:DNA (cytosine-5)-methyltransferase 1
MPRARSLTAIDLFAGCGGLTVGLKRAGFRVISAVEIEPRAYATYRTNHPEVRGYLQDIRTVAGRELLAGSSSVDLLAGCPPCQGFSSLTSKWRRSDPRDDLVDEMGRMVAELRPRVVMMENVPGLVLKGRAVFDRFVQQLTQSGYRISWDTLQVADYGIPQRRRRLVLLAGKGFEVRIPAPTHARDAAESKRKPWRSVASVIKGLPVPLRLDEARARGGPQVVGWHVVRQISNKNQSRLRYSKPGEGWTKIPKRLRPDCHSTRDVGFRNAYGRMRWDEPSVTITGGCTTPSKGRFGHPQENRTISVREAALLQTFPPRYVFESAYIDSVCEMIGNALPCDFAETMARACVRVLAREGRTE